MNLNDLKNLANSENLSNLKDKVSEVAHTVTEKAGDLGKSINNDTVKNLANKAGAAAKKVEDALGHLPGVAVDKADKNKATATLEKEETAMLNNNPRNNDM